MPRADDQQVLILAERQNRAMEKPAWQDGLLVSCLVRRTVTP